MTKYLILGNGFIGNKFQEYFNKFGEKEESVIGRRKINSIKDIHLELTEHKSKVIINCIGKTGRPNVDWCESHKEETFFSNVTIPTYIAEVCEEMGIYLVHMGSGCIYGGDNEGKGWSEDDKPNFFGSFYSRTKIFSEQILKEYKNVLQLRIRMPCDSKSSQRNLIDKLIGYKRVIDISNSITFIPDFLKIAKELIDRNSIGIYNITNQGSIKHGEMLSMYKEIVDPSYELPEFIELAELKNLTVASRSNCILSVEKLKREKISVRNIRDALREGLYAYRRNIRK